MLTICHVVYENITFRVGVPGHVLFSFELVDDFQEIDLAVVKLVIVKPTPDLELAETPTYEKDAPIYFIGNPLKFSGIANKGNLQDEVQLESWEKSVIIIDAPVYRGNSGSPVINDAGEVIGVVFATINDDDIGKVGLFVPIDYYHEKSI